MKRPGSTDLMCNNLMMSRLSIGRAAIFRMWETAVMLARFHGGQRSGIQAICLSSTGEHDTHFTHFVKKSHSHRSWYSAIASLMEVTLIAAVIGVIVFAISHMIDFDKTKSLRSFSGRLAPVYQLAVISGDQQLWVKRWMSEVSLVDLGTGVINRVNGRTNGTITDSCVSQDGQTYIALFHQRELVICRNRELIVLENVDDESISVPEIALSKNGSTAVLVFNATRAWRWDLTSETPVKFEFVLLEKAEEIAFDSTGDRLFACAMDGTIRIYDVRTGNLLQTLAAAGKITEKPICLEQGTSLAVVRHNALDLIDLRSGETVWTYQIESPGGLRGLAFSDDGRYAATGGFLTGVHVVEASSGKLFRRFNIQNPAAGLAFSHSSDTLFVGTFDGTINRCSLSEPLSSAMTTVNLNEGEPAH